MLAGDCSVVPGSVLGLRLARRKAHHVGLLFVDGHVDFYQPDASPTGEVADTDLALVTGHGPRLLTHLYGPGPLVREADVAAVGARDAAERDQAGAQDIAKPPSTSSSSTPSTRTAPHRQNLASFAGLSVAIYNPALDPDGRAAQTLVDCIAAGLAEGP